MNVPLSQTLSNLKLILPFHCTRGIFTQNDYQFSHESKANKLSVAGVLGEILRWRGCLKNSIVQNPLIETRWNICIYLPCSSSKTVVLCYFLFAIVTLVKRSFTQTSPSMGNTDEGVEMGKQKWMCVENSSKSTIWESFSLLRAAFCPFFLF